MNHFRKKAILFSVLTAGLSTSPSPGFCQMDEMINQAVRFHFKGYDEAADEELHKIKQNTSKIDFAMALLKYLNLVWTSETPQKDISKLEKLLHEAIEILDSQPKYDNQRLHSMLTLKEFYAKIGEEQKAAQTAEQMDELLNEALKEDLRYDAILACTNLLSERAENGGYKSDRESVSAGSDESFNQTKKYLDQIDLFMQKPEAKSGWRASYLRDAYFYYAANNKSDLMSSTKDKLSKLLGSTNENILFSRPIGCPACGRG